MIPSCPWQWVQLSNKMKSLPYLSSVAQAGPGRCNRDICFEAHDIIALVFPNSSSLPFSFLSKANINVGYFSSKSSMQELTPFSLFEIKNLKTLALLVVTDWPCVCVLACPGWRDSILTPDWSMVSHVTRTLASNWSMLCQCRAVLWEELLM